MGKRARAKRHKEKMNAKRALKAARKAFYESLRGTSKNKKSKREVRRGKRSGDNVVKPLKIEVMIPVTVKGKMVLAIRPVHGGPECGNVGCKRCSSLWEKVKRDLTKK